MMSHLLTARCLFLIISYMGTSTLKRIASGLLAGAVVFSVIVPAFVGRADTNKAVTYLQSKPLNAWSIMALAAAGQTPSDLSAVTSASGNAIDFEAPILALTAANKDPRTFPSSDYVATLKAKWNGTQLGDASILNDDVFGALALSAAGVSASDAVLAGLKTYIPSQENSDGGFPFAVAGTSDTNTTAAAIMAMLELGIPSSDQKVTKAVTYLKNAQNNDGGFPYDPQSQWGTDSDASSDAWVLMAINKLGDSVSNWTKNGKTPTDNLLALQDATSGFFKYQASSAEDSFSPVTTAYAVIALTGKSFPIAKVAAPTAPHVFYRIAGRDRDLCVGETNAVNALQLVKDIATSCNFDYHVTHYSFGDYLDTIGSDVSSGNNGWQYLVNNAEPSVGADSYQLAAEDQVLWYYTSFGSKITRLSLSADQVATGATVTATVEYLDGSIWKALSGAAVHAGNTLVNTGTDGKAVLQLPDGTYKLYATEDGYVRSESETLTVGTRAQSDINLAVDLGGGGGGSTGTGSAGTISFTLAPASGGSNLDFGSITRGQTNALPLTIANKSSNAIHVEGIVSGDKVFTTYLKIGGALWRNFADQIDANHNKNVDVSLNVPSDYADGGAKGGKLTIWASTAN